MWKKGGAELTYARFLDTLMGLDVPEFHVLMYGRFDSKFILESLSKPPPFTLSAEGAKFPDFFQERL